MASANQSRINALSTADISKSFLKSLQCQNRNEQITNTQKVLQFINDHIDDDDTQTLFLIGSNLSYLASFLSQFPVKRKDGGGVRVPPNFNLQERRKGELLWVKCGLHKVLIKIIKKYQETKWMKKHGICIFMSFQIITTLLYGASKQVFNKIITETDIIKIALQMLSYKENENNITFIERFQCVRMLDNYTAFDHTVFVDILKKYNLNIAKLLIKECCNCFRLQLFYHNLQQYQKDILLNGVSITDMESFNSINSYQDMPTYMRSEFSNTDEYSKQIHKLAFFTRMSAIKSLINLAQNKNPNTIAALFNEVDVSAKYLKRLLQQTMSYMRQGKQVFPPDPNTIDIIVLLSQHEFMAKRLVSDQEIVELLIIGLRSRSYSGEFNYREIVSIMYHIVTFKLLSTDYYQDLIFVLMELVEMEWKNFSLQHTLSKLMPILTLSTMIFRMLRYLFGINKFENSKKENYLCSICQDILNAPHTVKCGHSFCYGCLTMLIGSKHTITDVLHSRQRANQCPLCRSVIEGQFDRDEAKSAFLLDFKLQNKMYSEKIVFVSDKNEEKNDDEDFVGTECEYWHYIEKKNLFDKKMSENEYIKKEFIRFCKFMQKETKVYDEKEDIKKIEKENALKAKEIKLKGNELFKQEKYEEALIKYREALNVCPLKHYDDRVIYYSNITLTLIKMKCFSGAFRSALSGLIIDPLHIKLLNNCIHSIDHFLKCGGAIPILHPFIKIGKDNTLSQNRRLYDIILLQLIWDFELRYIRSKLLTQSKSTQQDMILAQKLRATDPFLIKNNTIQYRIPNFMPLNFDEYQFAEYIQRKNKLKLQIRHEINQIIENKEIEDLTIDNAFALIATKFKDTKESSIFNNVIQNEPEYVSILLTMENLRIEGRNIIVEQKVVNEEEQDAKTGTNELEAIMEWKHNEEDIVESNVYKWEC